MANQTPPKLTEQEPSSREFYTVSQLAQLLQLTEMTIYRIISRGELPHYVIGRVKRFRASDLEEFLASRRQVGSNRRESGYVRKLGPPKAKSN